MRQLSKHDVNRLSVSELKELLPFEITNDGEVIAEVVLPHDVNRTTKASHDVNRLTELPLSKHKQAKSMW